MKHRLFLTMAPPNAVALSEWLFSICRFAQFIFVACSFVGSFVCSFVRLFIYSATVEHTHTYACIRARIQTHHTHRSYNYITQLTNTCMLVFERKHWSFSDFIFNFVIFSHFFTTNVRNEPWNHLQFREKKLYWISI